MNSERVILGNDCIYSLNTEKTGINRNVIVVGGSGSGKTVSFDVIMSLSVRSNGNSNKGNLTIIRSDVKKSAAVIAVLYFVFGYLVS